MKIKDNKKGKNSFLNIFILSATLVMIEIISLRYGSFLVGNNIRFILISFSLAGFGFGASLFYFKKKKEIYPLWEYRLYLILATIFLFSPYFLNFYSNNYNWLFFGLIFSIYSFLGFFLVRIFYKNIEKFALFYGLSLLGSAVGILLIFGLFSFGYQKAALVIIVANTILLVNNKKLKKTISAGLIFLCVIIGVYLFLIHGGFLNSDMLHGSSWNKNNILLAQKENALSRLDFYRNKKYEKENIKNEEYHITKDKYFVAIDSFTYTSVSPLGDYLNNFSGNDWYKAPYFINEGGSVAVVGSGAGTEVARAISADYEKITSIEINEDILKLVESEIRDDQNPNKHPKVRIVIDEGRHFLSSNKEKFDLIYFPHVGSNSILRESNIDIASNYLFTIEAIEEYYNENLKENGVIAIANRFDFRKRDMGKTLEYFIEKNNLSQNQLILIEGGKRSITGDSFMFLLKKNEFSLKEKNILEKKTSADKQKSNVSIGYSKEEWGDGGVILSDNHPYFGGWKTFTSYLLNKNKKESSSEESLPDRVIYFYLKLSLLPVLLILAGYWFWLKKRKKQNAVNLIDITGSFFLVSVGFIFLELGYVNSMFLIFKNPLHSFGLILILFILFSGIGSLAFYFKKESLFNNKSLRLILFSLSGIVLVEGYFLSQVVHFIKDKNLITQGIFLLGLIAPVALLAGIVFPYLIETFCKGKKENLIYAYIIDSLGSVFAGITVLVVSFLFDFRWILWVGALFYLLIYFFVVRYKSQDR